MSRRVNQACIQVLLMPELSLVLIFVCGNFFSSTANPTIGDVITLAGDILGGVGLISGVDIAYFRSEKFQQEWAEKCSLSRGEKESDEEEERGRRRKGKKLSTCPSLNGN
ncbi:hypothetical protein PanWU01x14_290990 [Parasponia andersonii]|uniref:Uncharacterized protein n=1 Tax=Parasponia andersonii TaxID=3476 RepID=A0A2P5AXH7_PARAD|nr:hypothetical protein PanWU01x14_290990 [Parasponia andersonii]